MKTIDHPYEKCSCGKPIPYMNGRHADGSSYSVPAYTVWDGGVDFGRLSHVAVCKACYDEENRKLREELNDDRW